MEESGILPSQTEEGLGLPGVELIVEDGLLTDSLLLENARAIALQSASPPGLNAHVLDGRSVTVRLSAQLNSGVEATSLIDRGLIELDAGSREWEPERLERVVRHEMAHLALAEFMEHKRLPNWLDEGYAVWASGGLDCRQLARLRLDLLTRERGGRRLPALYSLESSPAPIAYAYYAAFIDYVEARGNGIVSDGRLFATIKQHDIRVGFAQATGVNLTALEADWQRQLPADLRDRLATCKLPGDESIRGSLP